MKPKELRKKLTLKKQTISHLEEKQQDAIRGGGSVLGSLCWKDTLCGFTCDPACS